MFVNIGNLMYTVVELGLFKTLNVSFLMSKCNVLNTFQIVSLVVLMVAIATLAILTLFVGYTDLPHNMWRSLMNAFNYRIKPDIFGPLGHESQLTVFN